MTHEEILAMGPGLELDALVAEHIFGWRRITGPKFDYDGPCESNDVLVPPDIMDEEVFRLMPARGVIPFTYFVNHGWSVDIAAAWKLINKFGYYSMVETNHSGGYIALVNGKTAFAFEAPEAICRAALLAVLEAEQ